MKTVARFGHPPEAYFLQTLLASEDIEAEIVGADSMGYLAGGSSFNAIRVEVDDADFGRAREMFLGTLGWWVLASILGVGGRRAVVSWPAEVLCFCLGVGIALLMYRRPLDSIFYPGLRRGLARSQEGMQILCVGAAAFLAAAGSGSAALPWQALFNGSDLAGWVVPQPNPFWKVAAGGVLVGENNAALSGSMLFTQTSYQDFLFETEVRWSGEIDSGIMLRKPELQLQLGVSRSLQRDMTCSFYTGSYPPSGQGQGVESLLQAGQWNTIRLEALGGLFSVWLNGTLVTEFPDSRYGQAAPIGLQIHAGLTMKVEFRNLRIIAPPVADADEDGLPDAWERGQWSTVRHGATDDPDKDGLGNLLEFALGLNPAAPGWNGLPRQEIDIVDGAPFPTITIDRNPAAGDLAFRPEASDDLIGWRSGALEFVTIEDTPARLRVRATTPTDAGIRRFFRLTVSPP